ncbi:unnamed protein product, partial [Nesidiocoris tenuis]
QRTAEVSRQKRRISSCENVHGRRETGRAVRLCAGRPCVRAAVCLLAGDGDRWRGRSCNLNSAHAWAVQVMLLEAWSNFGGCPRQI